jgi:hypothetical protein
MEWTRYYSHGVFIFVAFVMDMIGIKIDYSSIIELTKNDPISKEWALALYYVSIIYTGITELAASYLIFDICS